MNQQEVLLAFAFKGSYVNHKSYGNGHINDTFFVEQRDEKQEYRYILQRVNHNVFKNPKAVIQNIEGVTAFLKDKIIKEGGNPKRETLNLIPTKTGDFCYQDEDGEYWRAVLFIEDSLCYEKAEKESLFQEAGFCVGKFQSLLQEYPVNQLIETIPDFHNTPLRYETFLKAVKEDGVNRVKEVLPEIAFLQEREKEYSLIQDLLNAGEIPYRVTHNDTKLNNILFDKNTKKAICLLDLDTVMPGTSLFDFGDSIRSGASTATESENNLHKVQLSLPLFEAYATGYLCACGDILSQKETELLPMGAKLMTLESGLRFLTDYLQGDTYFKIEYPTHNLARCRNQLALALDMEKKWADMESIIHTLSHNFGC